MTSRRKASAIACVCLGALALAGASGYARTTRVHAAQASDQTRAQSLPATRSEGFVGSMRCRACHPSEYSSWHESWHRTMTQAVGPSSVIAAFDGRALPHADGEHTVERRGEEFWLRMPEASWLLQRAELGPDALGEPAPPMQWQRAVMSTGAHNMQMYWVAAEPGRRLVAFPFSWSVEGETWVANEATLLRPYEPYVVYGWNEVCVKCHAVAGAPEFAPDAGRVETEVAELGIACEACHGPGEVHVRAQQSPLRRYLSHLRGGLEAPGQGGSADTREIVHPGRLGAHRSAEICGQCHSASVFEDHRAWLGRGSDYRAGDALAASTRVVRHPLLADQPWIDGILDEDPDYLAGRFWPDGAVRISGRDYNGLIESPCYQSESFGCGSCHEMHGDTPEDQLRPLARDDDDRQCTQCHEALGEPEALQAHSRHTPASVGARCVNCHMPHTVYGLTKAIRSHRISVPSVEESASFGRPNACNACHLDRSLAWTARELEAGWNIPAPTLEGDAAGDATRSAAASWLVRGDAGQRALAAWAFGWAAAQQTSGHDWLAPLLVGALADDYAAVRWVALRSLRTLPGYTDLEWSHARPLAPQQPLDAASVAELRTRWPGSERDDPALYLGGPDHPQGFDDAAWARDHAARDTRVIDLRE